MSAPRGASSGRAKGCCYALLIALAGMVVVAGLTYLVEWLDRREESTGAETMQTVASLDDADSGGDSPCTTCAAQVLIPDGVPGSAVDELVAIINGSTKRRCWFVNQVYSALWDSQWRPREGATIVCNWWVDRYVVTTTDQGRTWMVEHTHNAEERDAIAREMGWPPRLRPEARSVVTQPVLVRDPCTSGGYFTNDGGAWFLTESGVGKIPVGLLWLETVIGDYRQSQSAGEENLQRHLWNLGKGADVAIRQLGQSLGKCP